GTLPRAPPCRGGPAARSNPHRLQDDGPCACGALIGGLHGGEGAVRGVASSGTPAGGARRAAMGPMAAEKDCGGGRRRESGGGGGGGSAWRPAASCGAST